MLKKVHAVVAWSKFRSQKCTKHVSPGALLEVEMFKSARRCGAKHFSKPKCAKHYMLAPLLDASASFCVAGARDSPPCPKWAKGEGFVAFPKTMAGVWHLKRICKDTFRVAGAVQRHVHQRCWEVRPLISWEVLHFGASDLQVCEGDFAWQVQHFVWLGITYSWQAEWKNCKNALVREGSLAEFFRFWCCQLQKLRKSPRIAVFLMLSPSKMEEVLQNCCVFDVVKLKDRGSLAE